MEPSRETPLPSDPFPRTHRALPAMEHVAVRERTGDGQGARALGLAQVFQQSGHEREWKEATALKPASPQH